MADEQKPPRPESFSSAGTLLINVYKNPENEYAYSLRNASDMNAAALVKFLEHLAAVEKRNLAEEKTGNDG